MRNSLDQVSWNKRFSTAFPGDPILVNKPRQVRGALYSIVYPTPVSQISLIAWSDSMAGDLGLLKPHPDSRSLALLGGNHIVEGLQPYAMRYGGHQFGHWAGQLGDGRAITLGELDLAGEGGFREIQLKGAGPTPYSRHADGRAVLRSSIREYLASEAMFALGVPTTRALSLVLTGDRVLRDMFYDGNPDYEPGAIVCRVAPSFVRFGHFEILKASGEMELLNQLVLFIINHHMPELAGGDQKDPDLVGLFFDEVCLRTARLMSHWMRVGFVHGVMNTDNMSILGETIDYGPFGWLDVFDPQWTPNTTDFQTRRYRYGEQPRIGFWNLSCLAQALEPLFSAPDRGAKGLEVYQNEFNRCFVKAFHEKLGISGQDSDLSQQVLNRLFDLLERSQIDMAIFFRQLASWWTFLVKGNPTPKDQWTGQVFREISALSYHTEPFSDEEGRLWMDFLDLLYKAWTREADTDPQGDHLNKVNPKVILRNYLVQEVIDAALQGDLKPLNRLEVALQSPYQDTPGAEGLDCKRPAWAANRPGCSALSCSS